MQASVGNLADHRGLELPPRLLCLVDSSMRLHCGLGKRPLQGLQVLYHECFSVAAFQGYACHSICVPDGTFEGD